MGHCPDSEWRVGFVKVILLLLGGLFAIPGSVAETQQIDVIEVQNRPAETLIDVIRPLLPPEAVISASGNQLVIRSTPEQVAKLHLLIEELDQPLQQFMLSVRFAADRGTRLDTGPASVHHSTRQRSGNYQVRALEGYPSRIQTTTELPSTVDPQVVYPGYILLDREKRQLVSNFYATPRALEGNRIIIDISTQLARGTDHKQVEQIYQGAVTGPLGEWLAVGGTSASHREDVKRQSTRSAEAVIIYLKAERIE